MITNELNDVTVKYPEELGSFSLNGQICDVKRRFELEFMQPRVVVSTRKEHKNEDNNHSSISFSKLFILFRVVQ